MTKNKQKSLQDTKVSTEQETLKIQEFVNKLGGVERARLAVEELARLQKSAKAA